MTPPLPPIDRARLVREPLGVSVSVAEALRCLRGDQHPFALCGAWFGGGAVLGADPVAVAAATDDPFALLDALPALDGGAEADGVGGGWVGFLGYGLGARVDAAPPEPPRPLAMPQFALAFYDNVIRCDATGRWWFEALSTPARERALAARLDDLRRRLADPPPSRAARTGRWAWTPGLAGHARAVAACIERIRAGDLYQANLTMRLEGSLSGDPLDLFAAANAALPTDRAAFVSGGWGALCSLSPELFLKRRGRRVESAPIKGTRRMPLDPHEAELERRELAASAKDRAENVMIVDLVRNDLGRVCEYGSVRVESLGDVAGHAGVWHMVSTVSGRLRDGVGDGELVRVAFPPGSVTGAPKLAATAVIAELESTGREAYTGAIGMAAPCGLELSVAIRTLEARGGRVWLGAGGGVVADSDPRAEAAEAAVKAQPLVAVTGGELPPPAEDRARGLRFARLGPRPLPRPDPRAGVFETVLVEASRPVALVTHLRRLAASGLELYGAALPPDVAARANAAARGYERGRLRIEAVPSDRGLTVALEAAPLAEWLEPVALEPVIVAGGLGAHKWRDRTLLEALEEHCAPALPLLVDADGLVLEASRANVVAEIGGRLVTPPLDGRILPGTARARTGCAERPLGLDELLGAEAVFVTSALRGLHPVSHVGGALAGDGGHRAPVGSPA